MHSFHGATVRAATTVGAIASVLLFATCDLDKISGTPKPLDQATINGIFSISGDSVVTLGGTLTLTITSPADLTQTSKRWSSSNKSFATVDSTSGVVSGLALGVVSITARLLAPELDTGYTQTKALRVRFKGIKVAPIDSITGLGLTNAIVVNGTNNSTALQVPAITTTTTVTSRDTTIARVEGQVIRGRKPGTTFLVGFFESFRDSVAIKVRQVAKSITFPATEYVADAVSATPNTGANRTLPLTVKDVADSVIVGPTLRWRSADTNMVTIDSITGVMRVKSVSAVTNVTVRSDTVWRSQTVRVQQVVTGLTKMAGDAQTDTVGHLLPTTLQVKALDGGSTAVAGATVTFKIGTGSGIVFDTVKTTDASGLATIGSWTLGTTTGTQTVIATSGSATTTFSATARSLPAAKLTFVAQPTSVGVAANITPAVTVAVRDTLDNIVTTATDSVTIAFGNNPTGPTATLAGTKKLAAVSGVATFNNLSVSAGGSGYTLQATSGALTPGISNGFDVFGLPAKIAFINQPVGVSEGGLMPSVRVAVQDGSGFTVASNSTAAIELSLGNNPSGATLGGTRTVTANAGIAEFTDLSVSAAGTGYSLLANHINGSLLGILSTLFNVTSVGPPAKLAFSVQPPSSVTAGSPISPQIQVTVQDANGATVTASISSVTLAFEVNTAGDTLSGTLTRSTLNGVASFNDVVINKAGSGYKLTATATSLTSASSNTFSVVPGAATKLGFVQQPTHTVAGTTMAPAVTVKVQDAGGNRVTTGAAMSVSLILTGCTAALNGGAAQNTVSGVATFSALSIATQVSNCVLTAIASGLTPATSTAFNSAASNGAARLSFTQEPATGAAAGFLMNGGTVTIQDVSGNNVSAPSAVAIAISVLSGPGTINSGTTSSATTTSATFSITFNTAGTYRLLASATGFRSDTSAQFTVIPASASELAWIAQPQNTFVNAPLNPNGQLPIIAVQDQFGNTVTSDSGRTIRVSVGSGPGSLKSAGNPVSSFDMLTAAGIVTIPSSITLSATGSYQLNMSAPFSCCSIPSAQPFSDAFTVAAFNVKSNIGFVQGPSNASYAVSISPAVTVTVRDKYGNTVTSANDAITVAIGTDASPTTALSGGIATAAVNGIASFPALSLNKTGTGYSVVASASGLAATTSSPFNVTSPGIVREGVIITDMVRIGGTMYFSNFASSGASLKAVATSGGAATALYTSAGDIGRLTTDGANVYWMDDGGGGPGAASLKKYSPASGTITTLASGWTPVSTPPSTLSTDGTNVYFVGFNQAGTKLAIRSVSVNANNATPVDLFTNADIAMVPPNFVVSGGFIYFRDPAGSNSAIRRMTTFGGSLTTLATNIIGRQFLFNGSTLYFGDDGAQNIRSIANAATITGPVVPTTLVSGSAGVSNWSIDGTNLYVNSGGTLRRYSFSDFSSFVSLSTSLGAGSFGIPIDAESVYFYDSAGGRIAKIPK